MWIVPEKPQCETTSSMSQLKSGVGADPNKPPCKKAKTLRWERKQQKLLKRGMSLEKIETKNEQKNLEDVLSVPLEDPNHQFKVSLAEWRVESDEEVTKQLKCNILYLT